MIKLWQRILHEKLSVRNVETIVKEKEGRADSKIKSKKNKSASIRALENELISILGTKVRLRSKGKKGGSILVDYFSNEDLERLLELLRSIS